MIAVRKEWCKLARGHNSSLKVFLSSRNLSSQRMATRHRIKGVIFDMDGTLTVPVLDFAEMRRRVGVKEGDILHVISSWPEEEKAAALSTIETIEAEALEKTELMPHLESLCAFLDSKSVKRGLVTRNVQNSIDHFHNLFPLPAFSPALGREFEPCKPDPAAILHICEKWDIPPEECVVVGDSLKHDVIAGKKAGAKTILLDSGSNYLSSEIDTSQRPDYFTLSLLEVHEIFKSEFII
mmetsp:Transcript_11841/g.13771  ORF Transcript_11841/g.13771 Transcript_11841/m.13771 type:complete len:238 (-) Transcript_11841:1041-1754(-)